MSNGRCTTGPPSLRYPPPAVRPQLPARAAKYGTAIPFVLSAVSAGRSSLNTTDRLTATNVFEKQNGSSAYSIIHHHACPTN